METDTFISKNQLDRFSKALAQAVFDKRLEQGANVHYFYDSEVILWIVLGFRSYDLSFVRPSVKSLLMRSLLSAGYLGTAFLLRPHALELDHRLRQQPAFGSVKAEKKFIGSVRKFLKSQGVERHLETLFEIVSSAEGEAQKVDRFLRELQEIGAETFVALELAHGSWQERIKRLHGPVLSFDASGGDLRSLLTGSEVWLFNRAISGQRADKRLSINNFRDATALAMLRRMISERSKDESIPLVRFHSEADSLKKILRTDREVKRLLSYGDLDDTAWEERFIFRESDYFILRASFEALSFKGVEVKSKVAVVSLDDLDKVSRDLGEALKGASHEALERAGKMTIGDRPLVRVIWELETLSFIRNVWNQYAPPKSLKRMILGLREIWAFAEDPATREQLRTEIRREIEGLRRDLSDEVLGFRSWDELFKEVRRQSDKLREKLKPHEIPSPMRDLGLVRWNFQVSEDLTSRIREIFESLIAADEESWIKGCANVASGAEDVEDEEDCLVICAILWTLAMFDHVVEIVNSFEDVMQGALPPSLRLMRLAARLRGHHLISRTERRREFDALSSARGDFENVSLGRFLLGLGYVAFYAWYSDRSQPAPKVPTHEEHDDSETDWATISFSLGEEAAHLLQADRLGWAFAVNHCAYVGTMTEVTPDRTATYLRLLAEIRGDDSLWHYRFADTLASSDYLTASRLWQRSLESDDRERTTLVSKACGLLRDAKRTLSEAGPYFGDPEIPQHKLQIEQLIKTIGC